MKNLIKEATLAVSLLISGNVNAAVTLFENAFPQWSTLTGSSITVIDFESINAPSPVEIIGNEFSGLTFGPTFTVINGDGLFVGNPSTGQALTPRSGTNMLFPECNPACEGTVRLTFDQAITNFGAFFIDVEADFATTGFSFNLASKPELAFSSFQGQNALSFLGFISDTPFDSIDIHFTTGPNIDGTLIDDVVYAAPVPIPAALWLFATGFGTMFAFAKRK